jgi:WD40 repeat protein
MDIPWPEVDVAARIVCQVVPRADRLTLIWSDGTAAFEPYHLAGREQEAFETLVAQARQALLAAQAGGADLSQLGHRLYRTLFRLDVVDGQDAQEIARWLQGQGQAETLEFLGDSAGRVPWNLLVDTAPTGGAAPGYWGERFNLAAGRRTNPLRFAPALIKPATLLALDAGLLAELPAGERSRLESWPGDRLILDSPDQLASHLRHGTPDVLVLLGRVADDSLRVGSQRFTPARLRAWIGEAREGNPNPLIFLGAAGTAEQAPTWESWLAGVTAHLDGVVTNIVPLSATAAVTVTVAAAERFLQGRRPLGAALADVRSAQGAAGLALTAFCPPGLQVVESEEEIVGPGLPRQPLPAHPYCALRPYGPDERPLFFGREEETLRLAALLDQDTAAGIILHGEASCGKTSLVQAGLWPFLQQEAIGFRLLCDRTPEETPGAEADYPPLLLRPGRDLAGQVADAVLGFCAQPLTYTTPVGKTVTIDLPAILAAHLGVPSSTAIQTPPPPATAVTTEPGQAPQAESEPVPGVRAHELWLALQDNPGRLGRLLDEVTRRLPYELVMTIDQGEELITLAESGMERERRERALDMLLALAESGARCKVLLILRMEYFGQLAGLLPARSGRAMYTEFFLEELGAPAMMDAVLGPTSRDEILYSDQDPYARYAFSYEEGLAQNLVEQVVREAHERQCGTLAVLQVVCSMLYDARVVQRHQNLIRTADLKEIGGVRGILGRYVRTRIDRLRLASNAREGLRRLVRRLTTRHPDGRVTRDLLPARTLKDGWKGSVPIEQAVNTATEQAGLFAIDELMVAGQPGIYVSLADDAVAQAGRQWDIDAAPSGKRSGVVDTLWIMIPLAVFAAVVTWFFSRSHYETKFEEFQEMAKKAVDDQMRTEAERREVVRLPHYRAQLSQADQMLREGNALGARQLLLTAPAIGGGVRSDLRQFEWDYLWNRVNPERYGFVGHTGTVHAVAVSANGKLAASASADGTVRVWDLDRGQAAALIHAGKDPLYAVALSPDGKTVAAAGASKVIRLWDLGDLKEEFITLMKESKSLPGHEGDVLAIAFAKDGQTLASAGADKTVMLWDTKAGKSQATLKEHGSAVHALAFTPDGKALASGGAEPGVVLWTVESGKKANTVATGLTSVDSLAFAPDGLTLAVGGVQRYAGTDVGTVRTWQLKGDVAKTEPNSGVIHHGRGVLGLAFLPGGKTLVSAGKDAVIRRWHVPGGEEVDQWTSHLGWVAGLAVAGDGTVVSGSYDASVKVWDHGPSRAGQVIHAHKDWVQAIAFAGGRDNVLVSGGKDGLVKLWDPDTGGSLGELTGHTGAVTAIAASVESPNVLAVATWDDKQGAEIKQWELVREEKGPGYKGKELGSLKGHTGPITCLEYSPLARVRRLASGSTDKTVIVWDADKNKAMHTLKGHTGEVRCLSYKAGQLLLTGGADRTVRMWDAERGESLMPPYTAHTDSIETIDYLTMPIKESEQVAGFLSGGLDQLLRIATIEKDIVPRGTTRAANHPITCMISRPGFSILVTGGWDGTVRLWGFEARRAGDKEGVRIDFRERYTFAGHTGPVRTVAMSLAAPILASGGHDGTIRLWRGAASSRPMALPKGREKAAK